MLANAIYFKARWLWEFGQELTEDHPFHLLNGDKVNAQMMSQTIPIDYNYGKGEGLPGSRVGIQRR